MAAVAVSSAPTRPSRRWKGSLRCPGEWELCSQPFCDVRSRTFQVEVEAQIGSYKRQFVAILGRNNPKDVQVLTFYWK